MICDETTSVSQTLVVLSAKPHEFMIYLWKKMEVLSEKSRANLSKISFDLRKIEEGRWGDMIFEIKKKKKPLQCLVFDGWARRSLNLTSFTMNITILSGNLKVIEWVQAKEISRGEKRNEGIGVGEILTVLVFEWDWISG